MSDPSNFPAESAERPSALGEILWATFFVVGSVAMAQTTVAFCRMLSGIH